MPAHALPERPVVSLADRPDETHRRRHLFVAPDGPGFLRLTVMDAKGAADSVVVRMQ